MNESPLLLGCCPQHSVKSMRVSSYQSPAGASRLNRPIESQQSKQ
jgi:hypothetical protein